MKEDDGGGLVGDVKMCFVYVCVSAGEERRFRVFRPVCLLRLK